MTFKLSWYSGYLVTVKFARTSNTVTTKIESLSYYFHQSQTAMHDMQ